MAVPSAGTAPQQQVIQQIINVGFQTSGVELGHYSYDALSERTGIAYGGTSAAAGGRAPIANTAAS